jgi:NAD(P)H-hydrate repair Nnr-like enzyme with NAD(P)H-hydrate dehydratase domain
MLNRAAYRDAQRREERQRRIDLILEREKAARAAKAARQAKRRKVVVWDADALKRLFAVMNAGKGSTLSTP